MSGPAALSCLKVAMVDFTIQSVIHSLVVVLVVVGSAVPLLSLVSSGCIGSEPGKWTSIRF